MNGSTAGHQSRVPWITAEVAAAFANAVLVLCLPALLIGGLSILGAANAPVRPPNATLGTDIIRALFFFWTLAIPLSLITAWRTWVHARNRRIRKTTGLRGIVEAGGVGFLTLIAVRFIGLRLDAGSSTVVLPPALIILYGGLAAGLGLLAGLYLWLAAHVVLWISDRVRGETLGTISATG